MSKKLNGLNKYTGEYFDETIGLQYNRARWYDPSNGRFVSQDPAPSTPSEPATLNKYIYADSDPVNGVDPSGEVTFMQTMTVLNIVSTAYTVANIAFQLYVNPAAGAMMIAEEVVYSKFGGAFGKQIAKITQKEIALFYNIWKKSIDVSKIKLNLPPSAATLANNLMAVGVPRPNGTQAHHIVGSVSQYGKDAQLKLKALGIDLNSAMNGVFLPGCKKSKAIGMIHCGKSTMQYEKKVKELLDQATTKVDAINVLNQIRFDLLNNSFVKLNLRA